VTLSRDVDKDEADDSQVVVAPLYPGKKLANWWLVVGNSATRQLLAIRKVTVRRSLTAKLEFTLPQGEHQLKLYVICDSYSGADQDLPLPPITVAAGAASDEDEGSEDEDGMEE
jgi:pre-mRNA-splicing helicase BRR2